MTKNIEQIVHSLLINGAVRLTSTHQVIHRYIFFQKLDFSPKKLHILRIFQNYCWLKDIQYYISLRLEPQKQADFMLITMTSIFNIHMLICGIER